MRVVVVAFFSRLLTERYPGPNVEGDKRRGAARHILDWMKDA